MLPSAEKRCTMYSALAETLHSLSAIFDHSFLTFFFCVESIDRREFEEG